MLVYGLLGLVGLTIAAVGLTHGPNLDRIAAGLGWPALYVQQAKKWGLLYGVPLEWILATIIVESHGNPNARGDADGRSVGLMQVNAVANAKDIGTDNLFDPSTNIKWGTYYLKKFRNQVVDALGGRQPPIPLDYIVRLAYKGPSTVLSTLRKGQNPANLSWAPAAINNWTTAMSKVRSLTQGAPRA